jgi:hypothetical protein
MDTVTRRIGMGVQTPLIYEGTIVIYAAAQGQGERCRARCLTLDVEIDLDRLDVDVRQRHWKGQM